MLKLHVFGTLFQLFFFLRNYIRLYLLRWLKSIGFVGSSRILWLVYLLLWFTGVVCLSGDLRRWVLRRSSIRDLSSIVSFLLLSSVIIIDLKATLILAGQIAWISLWLERFIFFIAWYYFIIDLSNLMFLILGVEFFSHLPFRRV